MGFDEAGCVGITTDQLGRPTAGILRFVVAGVFAFSPAETDRQLTRHGALAHRQLDFAAEQRRWSGVETA